MKPSLLRHLCCLVDGGPLRLEVAEMEGAEIKTGSLRSEAGRVYPIERCIPRFVDEAAYAATFDRQRQHVRRHFERFRADFDEQRVAALFTMSTGFDPLQSEGPTLDAGCGYGRFLRILDRAQDDVIGVDLSADSVELAFEFTGRADHVHLVQADLCRLPFPPGHFRRIFSVGVLHHTPDTRASFEALARHVCDSGELAIWVYAPQYKRGSNVWRKLTTKLPLGVVYSWCVVNEILFAPLRSLPRGGGRIGTIIPGGVLRTPFWLRVISDFDDLTPRFAHTHTPAEVEQWFAASGLTEIQSLARLTAVRGRKPGSIGKAAGGGDIDLASAGQLAASSRFAAGGALEEWR